MMANFWDLDGPTRLNRVSELMISRQSDLTRWTDEQDADGAKDHSRSRFVGRLISPGSSVMDIGCGARALRNYLSEGCKYASADLFKRTDDCQVVDLNKGEFPVGTWDCIVLLGVLEYIYDVAEVLRKARASCKRLYVDYTSEYVLNVESRRLCGWVNDLTPGDFLNLAISADWKNVAAIKVINHRYLYICDAELYRPK